MLYYNTAELRSDNTSPVKSSPWKPIKKRKFRNGGAGYSQILQEMQKKPETLSWDFVLVSQPPPLNCVV